MSDKPSRRQKDQKSARAARRWIIGLAVAHLLILGCVSLFNWIGPERWWASGLNMYLPQWAWGLPGTCLLVSALRFCWKWSWLPLLSLVWVAGPIMGLCWGSQELNDAPGSIHLRVMTYNVKWGRQSPEAIAAEIIRNNPDVLMIQDAGHVIDGVVGSAFSEMNSRAFGQYIVASRYPLDDLTVGYIPYQGQTHTYVRTRTYVKGTAVNLVDVHLVTPREGLNAVRAEKDEGVNELEQNISSRLSQTDKLVRDLRTIKGPLILAGDLNAPVQSLVCKKLANAGLRDAFSVSGRGYGYTYGHGLRLRHSYLRIDHVMASEEVKFRRCLAGSKDGADHRPVIAELTVRAVAKSTADSRQ